MNSITSSLLSILLFIIIAVSCSRTTVEAVQEADLVAAQKWFNSSKEKLAKQYMNTQLSNGKNSTGSLSWQNARSYNWRGFTYIEVPYLFNQSKIVVDEKDTMQYSLVLRVINPNNYLGAIGISQTSTARILGTDSTATIHTKTYTYLNGKEANSWMNDGSRSIAIRPQIKSEEDISDWDAQLKKLKIAGEQGTTKRMAMPEEECRYFTIPTTTIVTQPLNLEEDYGELENSRNIVLEEVIVTGKIKKSYEVISVCFVVGTGGEGFPPPPSLPKVTPKNDFLPESEACEPMSSELIAEDMNFENEINKPKYPKQALPKWSKVLEGYPKIKYSDGSYGELEAVKVYEEIGGKLGAMAKADPKNFSNACAARLSMALLNAGIDIPNIKNYTFEGLNGKFYFKSAEKLYDFIAQTFEGNYKMMNGNESSVSPSAFQSFSDCATGIYVMKTSYSGRAKFTGHATLYTGSACIGGNRGCQFSPIGGVDKILFIKLSN